MSAAPSTWLRRRRHPRLCGTLHIRDASGQDSTVPLRGRAAVLTGLTGYGEVWAVHTAPSTADITLMISYGPDGPAESRESGLCAPGETIVLGKVEFTWRRSPVPTVNVPRPRAPGDNMPRHLDTPSPRNANTRDESPVGGQSRLAQRLRNMVRTVTQSTRH